MWPLPGMETNSVLASGLNFEESSGSVSCLNPQDIAVWTTSIPSPQSVYLPFDNSDWVDFSAMKRPGEDAFSPSSNTGDSGYGSLTNAQGRLSKQAMDSPFGMSQDQMYSPNQSISQEMFSPSLSAASYAPQSDGSGLVLLPTTGGAAGGPFESLPLPAQVTPWSMPVQAAPAPASLNYPQGSSPHALRLESFPQSSSYDQDHSAFLNQDGMTVNIGDSFMSPHSPVVPAQQPSSSRTSSRATMSDYVSASGNTSGAPAQYQTTSSMALGVVSKVQPMSHDKSANGYVDAAAVISPISQAESIDQPAPVAQVEEWSNYLNMEVDDLDDASEDMFHGAVGGELMVRDVSERIRVSADENARSDPLYQRPHDDSGLYHCPFAEEGCGHTPVRLKCNYDKYIDSHLRPFRCHLSGCQDSQFSSTACLLRHQREAHAMHGHGHKPNLCIFSDCERSKLGHGFPRRYNLYDHMKRVHNYTNQANDSPAPTVAKRGGAATGRKRSAEANVRTFRVEKPQKRATKAEQEAQAARAKKRKEMEHMQSQWEQRRDSVQQRLQVLTNPKDQVSLEQIKEDLMAMEKIALRLEEMG